MAAARWRGRVLERRARDPRPHQEHALRTLVERASRTAFGRAHDLRRVRSIEDLRERVPVYRYADLQPWLNRALQGEPNVVWPGRVPYFAWSSGTTAGNKFLPITGSAIRQQQRGGFDCVASYLRWTRDTSLMDGKSIILGASSSLERRPSGVLVGDNTGIMAHHIPRIVRRRQRPSPAVRAMRDWDQKLAAIARESLDEDIRMVAGTPSWFPGFFDRLIAEARARGRGVRHVLDVWPNLRMLTGGGIWYEPYRASIESRLGRRLPYVDCYNATEGGIMGVQDCQEDPAMLLIPDNGVVYELVPVEEMGSSRPRRLSLWEAEAGVVYALVISTPTGLFGYAIGDCLRFVERFPHRFAFEGRTAAFLNVTGEHVSQGELERAASRAASAIDATLADFTVTAEVDPDGGGGARHVWWVELVAGRMDAPRFVASLDADLRATNGDYDAHRSSDAGLRAPRLQPVRRGTFEAWMRGRGKLGGQNKVPRVVNDAAAVESLSELVCGQIALSAAHNVDAPSSA